ncbi:transglutaminase family protein [Ilumatobacter nonamiensis]|uniref:transglutaminase family protein n=1 Tax=Ilumatobacter nonamiensis TaxID=467093 RepID=UPI00034544E8|nr:transglutaminase family protein [Ilumatobacter nonamiensis]
MTRYRVTHRTSYRYGLAVNDAYTVACLLPRDRDFQQVNSARVTTTPAPDEFVETRDVFGNRIVQLGVHHRHDAFEISAQSVVDTHVPAVPTTTQPWEDVAAAARGLRDASATKIGPYRALTQASTPAHRPELLAALANRVFPPRRPVVEGVAALSREIFDTYTFDGTATDWATPLDTVLEKQRGVCQDFAHLATAVLRWVGLPASYVSGYIETEPPPGEVKSIGADASHAWCSVWTGPDEQGGGWLDLDPTNDQVPPTRHVTVGWGRDYADVAPVRGVVLGPGSNQLMDVAVDVTRLSADP